MVKAISLFTGCGGSDRGLHALGHEVVMANDVLSYARDLYRANMPETDYVLRDVREVVAPQLTSLLDVTPVRDLAKLVPATRNAASTFSIVSLTARFDW